MKPYYFDEDRIAALLDEIDGWRGTRYWRQAGAQAAKGVGADCVSFVEKVLVNTGAIKAINWPPYVVFGGGQAMLDLIIKSMDAIPELVKVWKAEDVADPREITIPGDIWVRTVNIDFGGEQTDYHHLSIYVGDNTLIHMRERGLVRGNIHDRFALRKLQAIYRAYELQPNSEAGPSGTGTGGGARPTQGPPV